MLIPGHRGTRYRVYRYDDMMRQCTLAVVDTEEAADALVDKYSEQYPYSYVDYTNSL